MDEETHKMVLESVRPGETVHDATNRFLHAGVAATAPPQQH
jgi:hypothetical protein